MGSGAFADVDDVGGCDEGDVVVLLLVVVVVVGGGVDLGHSYFPWKVSCLRAMFV